MTDGVLDNMALQHARHTAFEKRVDDAKYGHGDEKRIDLRHSPESRAKVSAANRARGPVSDETRAKMRASHLGDKNAHWGQHHSTEAKTRIGAANRGRHPSAETRVRIGAASMGHRLSAETKERIRAAKLGAHNPNWGKSPSPETRSKMSAAKTGRPKSADHRANIRLAKVGEKNPNWRGGKYKNGGGYEAIRIHARFYLLAHRLVMERMLGRKLQDTEVVHHINSNRQDNRKENLALCNNAGAHSWCQSEEARLFFG